MSAVAAFAVWLRTDAYGDRFEAKGEPFKDALDEDLAVMRLGTTSLQYEPRRD